jgi:hypothetical protein
MYRLLRLSRYWIPKKSSQDLAETPGNTEGGILRDDIYADVGVISCMFLITQREHSVLSNVKGKLEILLPSGAMQC